MHTSQTPSYFSGFACILFTVSLLAHVFMALVVTVACPVKGIVLSHCWDERRPVQPLLTHVCPAETGSRRRIKLGPGDPAWSPTFSEA